MLRRRILLLAVAAALAAPAAGTDALDDALALVGLRRADLGWTPKGWWPRYPTAEYKLRAFDSLFAEPLDTVTFARGLAATAWEKLDPAELNRGPTPAGNRTLGGSLFQAVQRLGIDPRFGGFRGYSANRVATPVPLEEALLKIYDAAGRDTRGFTFGMELPYPRVRDRLCDAARVVPPDVSAILGELVLNLIDAHRWAELAFRAVPPRAREVVARRFNLGEEMVDAVDYCPEIDDVARTWDEASLWYAAQKAVDALDVARLKLAALPADGRPDFAFDWETPWGWVRVRGRADASAAPPRADRVIDGTDGLLIVDLGGDCRYTGAVGATSAAHLLSVVLDLAGDDQYGPPPLPGALPELRGAPPTQGAGVCGVGVLLDASGDDTYVAERYAQGVGQFGLGLLADLDGDDRYVARSSAQGCGYFGIGLLFDVAGRDEYRLGCDGQGLGGVAGVGVLADRTGDDRYVAERKHSVTGRPSYHSPGLDVGVSNAQGCGIGRRGDGSDGHSWAGGLGALLDGAGDDSYTSGNWAMGTGYWFGIGILHDRAGHDEYHGAVYTQGSGAHFCIGACVDEAGDDRHLAEENSHSSLAWAHDFTIGLLLDGAGDDVYEVDGTGLAYSINRSLALVLDLGGRDTYRVGVARRTREQAGLRPGYALNDERFRARDGVGTYFAETTSLGLFLDVGGDDRYEGRGGDLPPAVGNDRHWLDPPDAPNWADRNFSVGVDRPDGMVDLTPRPVRAPGTRPTAAAAPEARAGPTR